MFKANNHVNRGFILNYKKINTWVLHEPNESINSVGTSPVDLVLTLSRTLHLEKQNGILRFTVRFGLLTEHACAGRVFLDYTSLCFNKRFLRLSYFSSSILQLFSVHVGKGFDQKRVTFHIVRPRRRYYNKSLENARALRLHFWSRLGAHDSPRVACLLIFFLKKILACLQPKSDNEERSKLSSAIP